MKTVVIENRSFNKPWLTAVFNIRSHFLSMVLCIIRPNSTITNLTPFSIYVIFQTKMPGEERETIAKATCKYFRDGTTQEVKLNLSETPRGYSLRVTPPGREIRFFSSLLTPISELLNDGETQNLGPNTMGLQDVMLQVNGLYPGLISFHKKYLVLK